MPRKSITTKGRRELPEPKGEGKPNLLFVEDGLKEVERFRNVLKGVFECHHVPAGPAASQYLAKHPEIELVYLTMDFPSIPQDDLVGMEDAMLERFEEDEKQAMEFVRRNQGAFILHHLRKRLDRPVPILFSHDFSSELQRWDTLTSRYKNVYYLRSGMGLIDVADMIHTIIQNSKDERV